MYLELLLSIPPASTLTLIYDFEKAILRYIEYLPDVNCGFNIASAVIHLLSLDSGSNNKCVYLRTILLLLPLPMPDFSMLYNIIILINTVMVLGFGYIFNLLIRRFVGADKVKNWKVGGLRGIL